MIRAIAEAFSDYLAPGILRNMLVKAAWIEMMLARHPELCEACWIESRRMVDGLSDRSVRSVLSSLSLDYGVPEEHRRSLLDMIAKAKDMEEWQKRDGKFRVKDVSPAPSEDREI